MSEVEGLVEAETFAAVNPSNNGKLAADLRKLAARPEAHRYVFFMSPGYSRNERLPELERDGIQVWCEKSNYVIQPSRLSSPRAHCAVADVER